jgi:membrane carboxypeptidase/penicillin-binding protein
MEAADKTPKNTDFAMPSGLITARIDPSSGLLAYEGQQDAIDEIFLLGTAPVEVARPPDVADPNMFLMEQFDEEGDGGSSESGRTSREDRVLGGVAPP